MHQALHHVDDVLLATDFSPGSDNAAIAASDYARTMGARLHVLHVASAMRAAEAATERLAELTLTLTGVPVEAHVQTGRPADRIVKYAEARDVRLIVLGRHGRTGFTRALLGSVAEEVARRAPCPVLTVPCAKARAAVAAPPVQDASSGRVTRRCLVCAMVSDELICESCRARIRGQALQQKWNDQRGQPIP
jgi:nucleotide-binding universal stress UspA family protein